jgi:hypothetical protein
MGRILFIALSLFLSAAGLLFGQIGESQPRGGSGTAGGALPRGFYGIELGSGLGEVKDLLGKNPYFYYRGDPDVSFLPKKPEVLLECEGRFYVSRGLFQFHENELYIMSIILNPARMDYYSIFRQFVKKYGEPDILSPDGSVWENEGVRVSLEKPLTVKYVERGVFNKLRDQGKSEKAVEDLSRERFLESF